MWQGWPKGIGFLLVEIRNLQAMLENEEEMREKIYGITGMAKPRMTQKDKWKARPIVTRYWAFKDEVRRLKIEVPIKNCHVIFIMPIPRSWAKKKKEAMWMKPHLQVPDADNLCKGLLDAIYGDDKVVYDIRPSKAWGYEGAIVIRENIEDIDGVLRYLGTVMPADYIGRE